MTKETITDLESAADILKKGGVILYPTDTVWGIGCDATRPEAVARVYSIKRRVDSKAMISLVSDVTMLERWVDDIPEAAMQLAEVAVRPLTIIYDVRADWRPDFSPPTEAPPCASLPTNSARACAAACAVRWSRLRPISAESPLPAASPT